MQGVCLGNTVIQELPEALSSGCDVHAEGKGAALQKPLCSGCGAAAATAAVAHSA
jgi:hypothetical protein